ncbi:uncharacterized protein [Spinacia oleracea]|uniref:Uncharacterized protein n=1 Tax=Spinacia oleracea TaxID=3562 RepID=A0ABM3QRF7_SPIOL|nr:uncharacterized protein LOC110783486 [Spinacia oleracea]
MGKRNAPLPKEKKTEEDVVKGKGVSTRAGARTRTTACGLKAVEGSSSGKKRKVYDAETSGEEEPRTESNDDEDVVFYLDHLNVVPRQWCVMPRVAVWSQSDVDALIEADKKAGGDYGRTQSVDVAYGERHHPRLPRDMRGSYIAKEVLNVLTSRFERIEEQMHNQGEVLRSMKLDLSRIVGVREQDSGLKDTQSGGTSGGSVSGVAVCPALGGTQTMRPTTIPTATAQQFGVPSPVGFAPAFGSARGFGTRGFGFPPPSTSVSPILVSDPITPDPSSAVTSDVLGFMAPSSSDCSVPTKSMTTLQTEVQSPTQKPVITTEILKGVSPLRSSRKSRTDMEKELVAFIKEC